MDSKPWSCGFSRAVSALLVCLLWSLQAAPARAQGSSIKCWASCISTGEQCDPDPKTLANGAVGGEIARCVDLGPKLGSVQIRYRHDRAVFQATATSTRTVAMVLQQFPPDPCGLGDLKCVQNLMNEHRAPIGAKGADSRTGSAGGQGEPCARGLPCGQVSVPSGAWALALQDGSFAGQWVLSIIRSPKGETLVKRSLPVAGGRIGVPGGLLQPGTLYGYELLDGVGARVATGEFNVLAPSAAQALRQSAADRTAREGADATKAWLDTLVENGLEWNVYQLMVTGKAPQ